MCTIYGPICKNGNVTTVNKKINVFDAFVFQPLIKGKYITILWFITFYGLEMAPKIHNIPKFSKEQEIFANWAIDGAHYEFHENWLH
jgi:hypothetical protein